MTIQDSHWQAAVPPVTDVHGTPGVHGAHLGADGSGGRAGAGGGTRSAPLRVDAQRNLEHVLRAAREVFGELGYGAPMEDVARRARVGVGTVYRRFPSKDVLVRRIAEEETSRLTEQARTALRQEDEPWSALARFLRTSVASGAGRLLPPQVLRVRVRSEESEGLEGSEGVGGPQGAVGSADGSGGVPGASGVAGVSGDGRDETRVPQQRAGVQPSGGPVAGGPVSGAPELRVVGPRSPSSHELDDAGTAELLEVVGQLVDRARAAGELRGDVTVADVLLVIATAAPSLPDAAQQAAASARLLDILLEGLRPR
ncbi:helix-turn-helix domain-containing protein [Streptomyces sp. NPDC047315]|uniref:TetR/AcrR family transcriptional regulator n=1 Tax=Streptomyces sp. NPDC047315 TaxID=3155142 RepID=UPI0033CD02F1